MPQWGKLKMSLKYQTVIELPEFTGVLTMTKKSSLLRGAREALAYTKGKKIKIKLHKVCIPSEIDVKAIREDLEMNRKEFCDYFGFSIRTLEKWEQGARHPEGPARAYLIVISHNPNAVAQALSHRLSKPY